MEIVPQPTAWTFINNYPSGLQYAWCVDGHGTEGTAAGMRGGGEETSWDVGW